ncbi:MAG: acyltransferase [Burkholderiaceae bacterium]
MGVLRLILAWMVIISHSSPIFGWRGLGADAVTAFFVISGFYMALILDQKYRAAGALWLFYSNRALRLFPLYLIFLLVYLFLSVIGQPGAPVLARTVYVAEEAVKYASDGSVGSWTAVVPNLFFLGSDVIRLFLIDVGNGSFSPWRTGMAETSELRGGYRYLVMPHIWSLGVEVVFYAIVPFLAQLRLYRLVVAFVALTILQLCLTLWLGDLAWLHLFSLWNLSFFALGMIVYRLTPILVSSKRWLVVLLAATPLITAVVSEGSYWTTWIPFSIGLPALFFLTKNWAFDKAVGDLSYPVYLCHFLFAWPAAAAYGQYGAVVALVLSCALSWVALQIVDAPIERWRARRVQLAMTDPASPAQNISPSDRERSATPVTRSADG